METQVRSLWPQAIRSNILSPQVLLRSQAEALKMQTGGVLLGEVTRREAVDRIVLGLNIVVPALEGASYRIISITHGRGMLYPAWIDSQVYRDAGTSTQHFEDDFFVKLIQAWRQLEEEGAPAELPPGIQVDSDEELIARIAETLTSPHVVSLAQSLIARANETSSFSEGPSIPTVAVSPPVPGKAKSSD